MRCLCNYLFIDAFKQVGLLRFSPDNSPNYTESYFNGGLRNLPSSTHVLTTVAWRVGYIKLLDTFYKHMSVFTVIETRISNVLLKL